MSHPANSTPTDDYDALTARNALESPLLRLPAELRNKIYEMVIGGHFIHTCHFYQCISCGNYMDSPVIHCPPDCVAVTKTCRQINAETKFLPITLNTFCGYMFDLQAALDEHFSEAQGASVKSLFILTDPCFPVEAYRGLSGLKKVVFASYFKDSWVDQGLERILLSQRDTKFGFAARVEVKAIRGKDLWDACYGWFDLEYARKG